MAQEIADSTLLDTWASGGNIVEPDISKIIEGWQLGEQPPHEYMNWLQNTFGSKLNHILKNGVVSWNNETEYLAGSSVQHNGNVWLCKTTNTNSEPTDANANWKRIITVESLTTILGGYVAKVASTDNAIVRFNGTTGEVQNSLITLDDAGSIAKSGNFVLHNSNLSSESTSGETVLNLSYDGVNGSKISSKKIATNITNLEFYVGHGYSTDRHVATLGHLGNLTLNHSGGKFIGDLDGNAATVTNGVYTTGDQTISGVKTFSSSPIVPTPTTGTQAANKDYVDTKQDKLELVTTTGTATFNGATQNINLTNIGNITLAIGDVIEVSGTTSNNKLFTVESIIDNNNIIVNYEHRGTSTPVPKKRLLNETVTNCTIKLYNRAKDAPIGQGQDWCFPASNRQTNQTYTNNTNRMIKFSYIASTGGGIFSSVVEVDGYGISGIATNNAITIDNRISSDVPMGGEYILLAVGSVNIIKCMELR